MGVGMQWFLPYFSYAFVAAIGACTGAIELIGRYKDAPVRALRTNGAIVYVIINIVAAIIGLYLLRHLGAGMIATTDQDARTIYEIMIAGLGSLVFLRSSVFKVKLNDTEVSIGPALLLDILLSASDREVDRRRGADRAIEVAEAMKRVSFDKAVTALPPFCFALLQNLTTTEQQSLFTQIKEIKDNPAIDAHVKSLLLGLLLTPIQVRSATRPSIRSCSAGSPPASWRSASTTAGRKSSCPPVAASSRAASSHTSRCSTRRSRFAQRSRKPA
jgi:hypothetical protein